MRPTGPDVVAPGSTATLLACALGIEARALRAARPVRTGMGPERAARGTLRALQASGPGPAAAAWTALVYAGLGAGVTSDVRPGEVVLATEVRDAAGPVATGLSVDAAEGLLRRAGLTVHRGVLHSSDHVVRGRERTALAAQGVACVDMETAAAFRAALEVRPGLPLLAVRVVVDTPEHELVRPATLLHGPRALRALKQVGQALATWQNPLR